MGEKLYWLKECNKGIAHIVLLTIMKIVTDIRVNGVEKWLPEDNTPQEKVEKK